MEFLRSVEVHTQCAVRWDPELLSRDWTGPAEVTNRGRRGSVTAVKIHSDTVMYWDWQQVALHGERETNAGKGVCVCVFGRKAKK